MEQPTGSKVVALWLSTGKKLDTTKGSVITDKGLIVRTNDNSALLIPLTSVVAIECSYDYVEDLDRLFNG